AVRGPDAAEDLAHRVLVRDVGAHALRAAALLLDQGDDFLRVLFRPGVVDDDVGALPGQVERDGPAYSARPSGYQGHRALGEQHRPLQEFGNRRMICTTQVTELGYHGCIMRISPH